MNRIVIFFIFIIIIASYSCKTKNSFVSYNDGRYFKEYPKIVSKDNRYFLRWRYADNGNKGLFFMMSTSEIKNDTLQFRVPTSSSSGNLNGKLQFEEVTVPMKIQKIKENKVVWKDPDGKTTPLKVEALTIEDEAVLMEIWKGYNSKSTF